MPAITTIPTEPSAAAGAVAARRGAGRGDGGGRLRPLDGVRAVAVLAVLAYHAGLPGSTGGLLGVDVFFVLSGYLITVLLCREVATGGRLDLGGFWLRRAKRLVPALAIMVAGVAVLMVTVGPPFVSSTVRGDGIATVFFAANWHFIVSDQGYFARTAAPSPFLHCWSLGVEEQYYLIWPLIAAVALRRGGRRVLATVAGVGALSSAALMAVLYAGGSSIDRLYYGTDTRAQALLVGSLLGCLAAPRGWSVLPGGATATTARRRTVIAVGVTALAGLAWALTHVAGTSPALYEGGFLAVAAVTGLVITAVTTLPTSWLGRLLSVRPLVGIGVISYGLYLYHWPIFLALDHAHTGLAGGPLAALRFAVTFAVAIVSYVVVERPIRTRFAARRWRGASTWIGASGAAAAAIVLATASVAPPSAAAAAEQVRAAGTGSFPPAPLRAELAARGALHTSPYTLLMAGDSLGLTLGLGLAHQSVSHYGFRVENGAVAGCDLDPGLMVRLSGQVVKATDGCTAWRRRYAQVVTDYRPAVSVVLLGRWETGDHLWNGQWVHVGEPAFDAHLRDELEQLVTILSARGGSVILCTMPYIDPPVEAPDGTIYPENLPSRTDAFDAIVHQVAAAEPHTVTLFHLHRLLDPGGRYTPVVDGVTVRKSDGIHISFAGGLMVQHAILTLADRLALAR